MRRLLTLLLVAWVFLPAAARAGDEDPKERARKIAEAKKAKEEADKKFAEAVNAAIDKGRLWLEKQQMGDGAFGYFQAGQRDMYDLGLQALSLLTLVKCGAVEKDPVMVRGIRRLREMYDVPEPQGWNFKGQGALKTYSVAAVILFYEALYDPVVPVKPGDRYAPPKKKACKFPKDVEEIVRYLVSWLVEKQEDQVWRYPGGLEGNQDLSNTQYALLALMAAARCGIDAPAATYKRALTYLLEQQTKEGPEVVRWIPNPAYEPGADDRYGPFLGGPKDRARGWAYLPDQKDKNVESGSMTTAGIAGLAICRDRLRAAKAIDKEVENRIERSMLDGIAWLSKNFTVTVNPGATPGWHYYYLYGLERAGAMTGLDLFGKHDWYREGAEVLLKQQMPDGGWPDVVAQPNAKFQTRLTQSCFALLFLRRATVPPSQPVGPVVTSGD